MGIFNKLFDKQENEKVSFNWIALNDMQQLDAIAANKERVSVLFKHSTRCIISKTVLKEIENKHRDITNKIDFYYLDLLNFRPISLEIAKRFEVEHQSPQMLVVSNGSVLKHASHHEAVSIELEDFI
tara:strand:+ start:169 stop:549 length:381 start_codon:yes stop_codon:yes gene_type:complete